MVENSKKPADNNEKHHETEHHKPEIGKTDSDQLLDDIYSQVKSFYRNYEQQSRMIKTRVESLKTLKAQKSVDQLMEKTVKNKSATRIDKAEQFADNYIKKIKKYDSMKQLKTLKFLKSLAVKEKQFKEVMKEVKGNIVEFNRTKIIEKKENLQKLEEKTENAVVNKMKHLMNIANRRNATNEKIAMHQDRNLEIQEGLVY